MRNELMDFKCQFKVAHFAARNLCSWIWGLGLRVNSFEVEQKTCFTHLEARSTAHVQLTLFCPLGLWQTSRKGQAKPKGQQDGRRLKLSAWVQSMHPILK